MSHPSNTAPKEETFQYRNLGPLILGLVIAGGLALLVCVFGGMMSEKGQFAHSWLFALAFYFTIVAGSLFWVLLHYAVEAEWSVVVRRILENVAGLFTWIWIFFIPILLFRNELYFWMKLKPGQDPLLDAKAWYLNQPAFWFRAVIFLGFFAFIAWKLKSKSVEQDKSGDPWITYNLRGLTFFPGLPCFAVFLTLGVIDWLMGLNYHWFSTMWGVYIFAGSALSSMCVLVLIVSGLRNLGYLREVVTLEHYHIMGKLMLAFTIFWAYIAFGQFFLIWYANIPEETVWFLRRNTETWNGLSIFLVVGHFFAPFLFLLFRGSKKRVHMICAVACWILFMHLVDMYLIVLPEMHPAGIVFHILDVATVVLIGCVLALLFLVSLGKQALFPIRDPRLQLSLNIKN